MHVIGDMQLRISPTALGAKAESYATCSLFVYDIYCKETRVCHIIGVQKGQGQSVEAFREC